MPTIAPERPDTEDAMALITEREVHLHQREAINLYERAGVQSIAAFGDYKPDPLSRFLRKENCLNRR